MTNMAEMQKQMFDQSQMQITMLMQMMGSIQQSQQELLRNELNRVHEISKELHQLQRRLGVNSAAVEPPPKPLDSPRLPRVSDELEEEVDVAGDPEDSLPAPRLYERDEAEERLPPPAKPCPAPNRTKSRTTRCYSSGCRIWTENVTAACKKSSGPSEAQTNPVPVQPEANGQFYRPRTEPKSCFA